MYSSRWLTILLVGNHDYVIKEEGDIYWELAGSISTLFVVVV